jgi:hypothetical protein
LESRKYQLQKQIIEALKANDNDLYSLLKSQWAHRFGVESLEELKNLDLDQLNQKTTNIDLGAQKIDQTQEKSFEGEKEISIKDANNQEKEIKNKELESIIDENNQNIKIKSYQIVNKENNEKKVINSVKDNRIQPEIKALIPLPPKPKYSYLKKWLLRK